ncbi:TNF receptor-associated factor 4 isoform X2 [Lingula anatina]|uniref:TNF receptor-associated factor 4 isoform X2 n=1 Tax=Lingula anatina TaxID=7574 RepID=A0A1S3H1C6_LINAN|nr:TNF receptor-associated factor 4 isoform X2 [Lingula anatina]|eukprot:XP_013379813.1 TNF receptor-associated factor 4 isoform X2 [Lingula anatina]
MPGLDYAFTERVSRRLTCPLCSLPMREPVQITVCGHRFCDSCLQEYLREGIFKCPEDELPLDFAKIYPDQDLEVEIMNSLVRCKHFKEGCKWTDKAAHLQAHLDICRYDAVPCPNQCAAMLSRICLQDHLEYTCHKRRVTCDFCGIEFSGEQMDNHDGECGYETVWCENKCGARLQRRFLNNHMKNECHKRLAMCLFCHKEFVFETLQTHQHTCPRFPISCPNRCDPTKIPREDIEKHVAESCPSASVPCVFKEAGCKYRCPRFSLDKHLDEFTKAHLSLMGNLVLRQQQEIKQLRADLQAAGSNTNGVLLWKIPNFKTKLAEAKQKSMELVSVPFHAGDNGYKLAASVFINGNGSGEGKYLSLYIKILQGEYDNLLEWPFQLPITFTIFDQCSILEKRVNVIESFLPDTTWKHFQKPSKDQEPMGFGYPKFVSHETLFTRNYIKDDTVFIKVNVDTATLLGP